jgi:trehalose utilization protein
VLAWSERSEPVEVYPNGINGAIWEAFKADRNVHVVLANMLDPEQGLSEATLAKTDVLVWFGHRNHEDVLDEAVERVVRHVVERGMGLLPLHSAHYSRPFVELLNRRAASAYFKIEGRTGSWGQVRNQGKPEIVRVLDPKHPIVKGVGDFTIPATEMYANPFRAPPPDAKILAGAWEGGEQDGSDGLIYSIGEGKVFYFRPGHETHPIYFQPEVQQILRNAVHWLAK